MRWLATALALRGASVAFEGPDLTVTGADAPVLGQVFDQEAAARKVPANGPAVRCEAA